MNLGLHRRSRSPPPVTVRRSSGLVGVFLLFGFRVSFRIEVREVLNRVVCGARVCCRLARQAETFRAEVLATYIYHTMCSFLRAFFCERSNRTRNTEKVMDAS